MACHQGHIDIVKELINAGADVNELVQDGMSCAYIAAYNGQNEVSSLKCAHYGLYIHTLNLSDWFVE